MEALDQIANRRIAAVTKQWVEEPLVLVQAESSEAVLSVGRYDGSTWRADPVKTRLTARSPLIVTRTRDPEPDTDRDISLWVRSMYRGYQKAFQGFLKKFYGLEADLNAAGYHVDHLINRARTLPTAWHRVELCKSDVNGEWGRTYEKARSVDKSRQDKRDRRTVDYCTLAKFAGLHPPIGPDKVQHLNAIVEYFAAANLPRDETRKDVEELLEVAAKGIA